jgi:hypothetical protein
MWYRWVGSTGSIFSCAAWPVRAAALIAALCSLSHTVAAAQTAQPLTQGVRVRVVQLGADRKPVVFASGTLSSLRGDTARVLTDGFPGTSQDYVLDDRRHLEVAAKGAHHVGRHVVRGALIGAVGVGVIAALSFEPCHSTEFLGCMFAPGSRMEAGGVGAILGAVGGGVIGLVVGLVSTDVTWVPAQTGGVHIALAPGGAGLVASLAF